MMSPLETGVFELQKVLFIVSDHFLHTVISVPLVIVQSLNHVLTLCNPKDCSMPGFPVLYISWSFLKLMSIESVILSKHLILYHPLLLLPSIFPNIKVFFNEFALHTR